MAKNSTRNIYQQSRHLKDRFSSLPMMNKKQRILFIEDVQALIDEARQVEQSTKSQQTKSRLQEIIEECEGFLVEIENMSLRKLPVISRVNKTSQALIKSPVEDFSSKEFIRGFSESVDRLVSEIMSSSKVDPNSPMTIPHDPKLVALYNQVSGIVDSKGRSK